MPQTKQQKQEIIDDLGEKMKGQKVMVFFDFTGLKVKDFSNLRKKIKAAGDSLKVAKKTLFSLALKKEGIEVDFKKMAGEIALVFGYKDEVAPAKAVWQFSQENKNVKILGGFLENKFFEKDKMIELAKLPGKEELLARLVGTISAPISNFVCVLQGNIKGLIVVLNAISKTK